MTPRRFDVGDRVRTRPVTASGHTRLPHYLAGRGGVVVAVRGAFALADDRALGKRDVGVETVDAVGFDAGDLFEESHQHRIIADLWESYLEPEA